MVDLNDPVIKGYLINLVGEEGYKVVANMPEGEVTDEKIAQATGVLLNIVRRTLFILYENRLASYRRERDTDSGWLTYLWKLDLSNLNRQLELEAKKLLKNLKTKLEYEEDKVFYICEKQDGRFLFEIAAEMEFKCPFCGGELIFEENEPVIDALKQRIIKLEDLTSSSGAAA
ncbi:MAG: transcription factor [Candidatus Methanoperedens sp.]|uniref:transcription factor n=1 Tax=Candidatus Methanoperedens sp. BLZ2 TaxID=2035255 RepID=UPI000BE46974|nr:transcription factor [Candidatus Methanoperedens sp. BLZ2]KAB2942191.1 MAG: transcription factor [Candidatus Methanoperedens sp.]MBZ0173679.1 transcription factor [Candidatus Methanoperedens nitroreducens]MCX9076355.1 transcription factor [Candidatus Methanoperedens sp.]MCX9088077.1 transcription factor [Candidatus Methanoperedens sp.]